MIYCDSGSTPFFVVSTLFLRGNDRFLILSSTVSPGNVRYFVPARFHSISLIHLMGCWIGPGGVEMALGA